jgi:regulator of nucleoside diphosphate kinase
VHLIELKGKEPSWQISDHKSICVKGFIKPSGVCNVIGPFICLRPEITSSDARRIAGWLEDEETLSHLSEAPGVSALIRRALDSVHLDIVTHLFNQGGRFFIAEQDGVPVGFARFKISGGGGAEIVLVVEKGRWGRRLGGAILREALKNVFFEMRVSSVTAVIHRDNHRSLRLFARAGFQKQRDGQWTRHILTMREYIRMIQGGIFMAGELTITRIDRERLNRLIDEALYGRAEQDRSYHALRREVERACVVEPEGLPQNVISMRSKALITLNGEEEEIQLVYPDEADWTNGRLSILSPVGTAILGYCEGDEIDWETAGGRTHIEIKRLVYQPEAAGDYSL